MVFHAHWSLGGGVTYFFAFYERINADLHFLTMEPLLLQEGATFDTWNSFKTALDEYSWLATFNFVALIQGLFMAANKQKIDCPLCNKKRHLFGLFQFTATSDLCWLLHK